MTEQAQHTTIPAEGTETGGPTITVKRITKKGFKIPGAGFADVRPLVQAMADLSGPSSKNVIFEQAGAAATGGTADTKWAALGYFGFRRRVGPGKHEISERGQDFISGDDARERHAKQHALVSCNSYRAMLKRFSTRPVNETALRGVMREEFELPDAKIGHAVTLFVSLATEAGFIVENTFRATPIEQATEAVPEDESPARLGPTPRQMISAPPPSPAPQPEAPPPATTEVPLGTRGTPSITEKVEVGGEGPFGVALEIKVESQHHTPEEIGQIVREVRQALMGD